MNNLKKIKILEMSLFGYLDFFLLPIESVACLENFFFASSFQQSLRQLERKVLACLTSGRLNQARVTNVGTDS
jgi:hypothetical protein